jgi:hypothetical protein
MMRCGTEFYAVARERRGDMEPHLRIGPDVVREIGANSAPNIDPAVAEVRADNDRGDRTLRISACASPSVIAAITRGRCVVGDAEIDACSCRSDVAAATEDRHSVLDRWLFNDHLGCWSRSGITPVPTTWP